MRYLPLLICYTQDKDTKNIRKSNRMSKQGRRIVACIDDAAMTEPLSDYASWAANQYAQPLTLLNISPSTDLPTVEDISVAVSLGTSESLFNDLDEDEQAEKQLATHHIKEMLNTAKARALLNKVDDVDLVQLNGNLKKTLQKLEPDIELLVIAAVERTDEEPSSNTSNQMAAVIRALHRPILVVNANFQTPNRLMIAFDGSDTAYKALEFVCQSPLFSHCICHLVAVESESHAIKSDLAKAESCLKEAHQQVFIAKLTGKVDEQLQVYLVENDIDITVMGAYSHTRIRDLLLGSLTTKILETAKTPLLLIR